MAKVEGNPALPDINALNDAEKKHLLHVMKRAKDFEVIEGEHTLRNRNHRESGDVVDSNCRHFLKFLREHC